MICEITVLLLIILALIGAALIGFGIFILSDREPLGVIWLIMGVVILISVFSIAALHDNSYCPMCNESTECSSNILSDGNKSECDDSQESETIDTSADIKKEDIDKPTSDKNSEATTLPDTENHRKFCGNCGTSVIKGDKCCGKCGEKYNK
jgi:hypothetical protein